MDYKKYIGGYVDPEISFDHSSIDNDEIDKCTSDMLDYLNESSIIPDFESDKDLYNYMRRNISYKNFTKLMSPEEVYKEKKGSCHDQVMFEMYCLRKMKYSPKSIFLIEYNDTGEGLDNVTHSFVYYERNNKVYWFENAWGGQEGIHEFKSLKDIKEKISKLHEDGKFGNYKKYPKIEFTYFKSHKPGESLQQLVDIALNESYIEEFELPKRPDEQKVSEEILDIVKPIILTSQNKSKASKLGLDLKCEITEVDSGMVFILVLDGPQDKRDIEEARSLLKDLASKCKSKLSDIVSKVDIGDGDEGCLFFTMDKGKIRRKRKDLLESYVEEVFGNNSAKNVIKKYKKDRIDVDHKKIYRTIKDPIQKIITSYCKSVPSFKIENINIESGLNFTWECKYDQKEVDKITRSLTSLKIGQVFKDVESQRPYKLSIFNGNIIKIDPGLYTIDDVSGNSYSGTITIEVLYTSYESSINKIDVKTLADVTSKMNIKSDFYINSTKGFVNINTSAVTKEDISVPSNVDIVKKDSAYFGTSIYLISKSVENVNESYAIDIKESDIDTKSIVFFTKNITPESLLKLYQFMTNPSHGINPLHGNIGVKISTGEYGSHNFLSPLLIKDLVSYLHGVIVECNTAYVGKHNTTEDHWKTIKAHGFLNIANCDIMDEEGDFSIPVANPYHIKKNYVGKHLKRYDSILMLSHFKGHAMAGYDGALKNMSIGMASSRGKLNIHTAGEGGDMMKADRNKFLESMVDADMSVMDYMGKENILYINVTNNLSIDCDCDAHPKDPDISDIGIFASTDPVALDQACIDAVYNHPEEKKRNLINRITSRNGTHTIDCAYEKGLGNKHYAILDIDQVIEEASIEEEIENEFSPTSFVKRSSLPAKNQKSHTQYLKRKTHSNKTNNATAQHELPKYNQIGELYVEEVTKSVRVKPVFIVTSYTNTPFGKAIKTFTHSEYTHAAISFDTSLEELYSFNADPKYNSDRYKGGISRESLSSYIESYDKTIIQVNCIFLKPSDFDIVKNTLNDLLENAEKTKYDYGNIINILIGKVKDTGMAMVCSQFVAYILHTAGIRLLDKSDNIVTPKDLSTITNPKVYKIFEGYAKDYEKKRIDRIFRKLKTKALLIKESLLKLCV